MNRERLATVALAVLFAAAAVPAILLRHEGVPSLLASATPTPTPSRTVTPPPTPAPAQVSCPAGSLAVYPGASLARPDPRITDIAAAIPSLGLPTVIGPGVAVHVSSQQALGPGSAEDLYTFYQRRMKPLQFWKMTPELRMLIGVRAHGEVDSPPLIYLSPPGDVVLLPHPKGDVAVTLLCSILEL